jgi:hypothetical protein
MMQLALNDDLRVFLTQTRALAEDDGGQEILVGLSREESEEYLRLVFTPVQSFEMTERELELADRHEIIRRQVVLAEADGRRAGPKH